MSHLDKPSPADGVGIWNVLIALDGFDLSEAFYGEDGRTHWTPPQ